MEVILWLTVVRVVSRLIIVLGPRIGRRRAFEIRAVGLSCVSGTPFNPTPIPVPPISHRPLTPFVS